MMRAAAGLLVMVLVSLVAVPLQWLSLKLGLPTLRWIPLLFHRTALRALGVRVHVRGRAARERPLLLVSNHASWLDIVVLSSLLPVIFIAKSEIERWPLFGMFAKLQRSIFVDRARRQDTGKVNQAIASRLAEGDPVVLFGEGKAGDGNIVLPFRSALMGALREALGRDGRGFVQPVSIAYTRLQGIPMGRQHRRHAAWYGNMKLPEHLLQVLRAGAIDIDVGFGVPVEVAPASDRKALARATEDAVRRMTVAALAGRIAPDAEKPPAAPVSRAVSLPAESR